MANDKHVAMLKKGVAAWNAWRDENPDIRPDLSYADLSETNLKGANLSGANLSRAGLGWAFAQSVSNLTEASQNLYELIIQRLRLHQARRKKRI
jgi:uncharacterized protein YjbI with pentapeptide repeats